MSRRIFLSIIIVTYNSSDNIAKCLKMVFKELNRFGGSHEVVVVDNNSKDTTPTILKNKKNIKVIFNKKNLGFARGVNQGINLSKGNLLLFLNPDTEVLKNSISFLVKCLIDNNAHIVGGKSFRLNGGIHGSHVTSPDWKVVLFDYTNLRKLVPGDVIHKKHYYLLDNDVEKMKLKKVDVVSGAFMLVKKEVFEKIGYFDENFFMYLEDVDFCTRAKGAGFRILFCPKSKIIHVGGASSKNTDRINHEAWIDSRMYYSKKHFSKFINIFVFKPVFKLDSLLINFLKSLK